MEDVALLAVHVVDQRDAGRAVRIVLNRSDLAGNAQLVALEINDAVAALVAPTPMAHSDAPTVVPPTGPGASGEQ